VKKKTHTLTVGELFSHHCLMRSPTRERKKTHIVLKARIPKVKMGKRGEGRGGGGGGKVFAARSHRLINKF